MGEREGETKVGYREAETREIDHSETPTLPYESGVRVGETQEEVEGRGVRGGGAITSLEESDTEAYTFPGSTAPEDAVRKCLELEGMLSAAAQSGYYVKAKIIFAGELGESPEDSGDYKEVDLDFGPYQFSMENGSIVVSRPLGAAGIYTNTLGEMIITDSKKNELTPAERNKLDIMVRITSAHKGSVQEGVNKLAESAIIRDNKRLDEESAELFDLAEDSGMHSSLEGAMKEEQKRRLRKTTQAFPFGKAPPKKD